jgi:hypothetical protein
MSGIGESKPIGQNQQPRFLISSLKPISTTLKRNLFKDGDLDIPRVSV